MKNLMTFLNPDKKFNAECEVLSKLQIDNSLELGWDVSDIMVATNFDFEYRGVKAVKLDDAYCCEWFPPATKIFAILGLFNTGHITDDLYWYHDFDTYQFNTITKEELGLNGYSLGVTNYGRMPRLCSASMFFTPDAYDLFALLQYKIDKDKRNEEDTLARVINRNPDSIGKQVKLLNITYAFHRFNLRSCYRIADKPIRAAHFHPTPDKFDFYMYGKNKLNVVLMPERLINIFKSYGLS